MRKLCSVFILIVFALARSLSWGAVQIEERINYLQGVQSDNLDCAWEASIVAAAIANSEGSITPVAKATADTGPKLSLRVIALKLASAAKDEYAIRVRGDVTENGKLLATRDFDGEESVKGNQSACPVLNKIGTSIGESTAEWISQTRFMECHEGCSGIHPDETIVVGEEILIGNADAINDTVRNECHWLTAMVSRIVNRFNENEPPPRAKLESRRIDIEKYTGRRLVLRVNEVHALGGGGITGPKWMDMSGELREGNLLVASFHSHTNSGRGLTTCRSLDSLSDSTTEMIVKWLNSPSIGAKLD